MISTTTRISFLGDIMCEPRMLKAAKAAHGAYDFTGVFANIKGLLRESDYVIGNLETPLAGKNAGYTRSLFSFNAPDSFAKSARDAGINLMLTANNHCLDRGIEGLKRTLQVLESNGIEHAGTFGVAQEQGNTYFNLGNSRFAVISYTYGTNYSANHLLLSKDEKACVNLLRPQNESYYKRNSQEAKASASVKLRSRIASTLPEEWIYELRRIRKVTVNQAHADDNVIHETMRPYISKLKKDIGEARKKADFVLFCPHIGGQFNQHPGEFTKEVFNIALECGVDAIIASHPHVVQRAQIVHNVPCFYSLGNFCMSPNSTYLVKEGLPGYGIIAHYYVGETLKTSFSIVKMVEKDLLTVYPLDVYADLCPRIELPQLLQEAEQIYNTVTGNNGGNFRILREYPLEQNTLAKGQ